MTLSKDEFLRATCLMGECERAYAASNLTLITLAAKIGKEDPEAEAKHGAVQTAVRLQRQHALELRDQVREYVPDWVGPFHDDSPSMDE